MASALRIQDLFERPVDRRIEEVIKVDQTDAELVRQELEEYVVTDSIRRHFLDILEVYRETPQKPHEGIGIWISGFFGSGKSSFAKILGYILEGREVLGQSASDLFLQRAADQRLHVLLKTINEKIPTQAVIFNVATDRGMRTGQERITQVMYRALLRQLDYAEDLDLAELEIALEESGELAAFEHRFAERYGQPWRQRRRLVALAINEASAVLHDLHPETYPAPDSWARSHRAVDLTHNTFAERALALMQRRGQGRALVFVIDEVGQYVGRSTDKMLDLQGVVEALGRVGRGRVWVVVTSQERLDEVVSGLDGARVEYARLMDRFPIRVDLHPSDISEVTSRRVLAKKAACEGMLRELFRQHEGALLTHTQLQNAARRRDLDQDAFVRMYPFLPYQMDLILHIISGLRTQGGAGPHVGGSNRTLIKLAQQVLIHPRVALGQREVGALVTLDQVYDVVEGAVATERKLEIDEIVKTFGLTSWEARVAKALCLLQLVRGVRRTAANLAAVLYPAVGAPPAQPEVEAALERLRNAQKVREGEEGWELLSAEGKRWEAERQAIPLGPADQNRWTKEILSEIWKAVRPYRHRGLRSFNPTLYLHGERLSGRDGDVEVRLYLAEEDESFASRLDEARDESRRQEGAVVWLAPLSDATLAMMRELHRSATMIGRYERERPRGDAARLLEEEKRLQERLHSELKARLSQDLRRGTAFFRGVDRPVASLGTTVEEMVHGLLASAVPEVYHKFDLAAVAVKGTEAKDLVKSANFKGLSPVVYEGNGGLGLVTVQGGKYVPNPGAPVAREVLAYIHKAQAPDEVVTGKDLESHFGSQPYGWDLEVVMLVTAALFRAAAVELTVKGRKVRTSADPGAEEAFATVPEFRATGFAPRSGGLTTKEIAAAHKAFGSLFGENVDMEEAALAGAIARRVSEEREHLLPLAADLQREGLPGADLIRQLADTLRGIAQSSSDDAIRTFAQQQGAIRQGLEAARQMRRALAPSNLETLRRARRVLSRAWPPLAERNPSDSLAEAAARLRDNLQAETWYERLPQIAQDAGVVAAAYRALYQEARERRDRAYRQRIEEIRSLPDFDSLPSAQQAHVLEPLSARLQKVDRDSDLPQTPSLAELEADLLAADGALQEARRRYEQILRPEAVPVQVRQILGDTCETETELEERLQALREHCLKLLHEGKPLLFEYRVA